MEISPFDKLPDEIISRIFTIGYELDLDGDDGSWIQLLPDESEWALHDRNTPTPTPFAAVALFVCRRWHAIVHARSNRHLWIIYASFNYRGRDIASPSGQDSLAHFNKRLSSSQGCNIYAQYWNPRASNATELALEICFAVLFIVIIKRHHLQIDSLSVRATHQMTSLILRLVNNIGVSFHPHILTVTSENPEYSCGQMEFEEIASTAASLYSMNLLPGSAQERDEEDAKAQYLDIRYVDFDLSDNCIPTAMSFIHGQLREIMFRSFRITLEDLQRLLICCPVLRELETAVVARPALDSSIFDSPMVIQRRCIKKLRLFAEDNNIVSWILQSFEMPHLSELKFGWQPDATLFIPEITFPSLQNIDPLDSISRRDFRHLSSVRLSALQEVAIGPMVWSDWELFAPLWGESLSLTKLHLYPPIDSGLIMTAQEDAQAKSLQFPASPPSLFLWEWNDAESFSLMLRIVNLAQTCHVETEVRQEQVSISSALNYGWRFNMPALSSMKIWTSSFARAIEFALELISYLLCPRLQTIEIKKVSGGRVSLLFERDQGSDSTICTKAWRLEIDFQDDPDDSTVGQVLSVLGHRASISGEAIELKINFDLPDKPARELLDIVALLHELLTIGYRILPNLKHIHIHVACSQTRLVSKSLVGSVGIQGLVEERRRHGCPLEEFRLSVGTENYLFQ
jgi:hypothetical protein